ncbi:STIMATE family protein [Hirsutella rhossiliensis]|uniref:STIMATE family domain-containing protein n=1 Tax=Hirsutella rhossiliensis TaxID=111463 RepID=A0A9P8MXP2_9HYPO|nr:STIMATE family domain-containing protein [Hirsutella rhossiliensis]KAH0963242.1 STIMATE family domain-containing protein [Hirsutella rhossiliensis]
MHPPAGALAVQDATTSLATAVATVVASSSSSSPSSSTSSAADLVQTAMATATAALVAAIPTSDAGPTSDNESQGECRLLGSFALLVQAALGALALLSLVFKRWRERPQRPLKIWSFDVSKQVFGSVLVHAANVFMSMLTSGRFSIKLEPAVTQRLLVRTTNDSYEPNPCSLYLLNLAIDTTLGIPILIILLRILTGLVAMTPMGKPLESIQSGNYGNPPNALWWLKQSIIYFGGLFGMKLCVLVIFLLFPWISTVGDWALGWTEGNERLQIAFVMMIFPLIMNAMQYYIIDSLIKKKETDHEPLSSEDPDQGHARGTLLADHAFESESESEDYDVDAGAGSNAHNNRGHDHSRPRKPQGRAARLAAGGEYDPEVDGDAPTVIGSSSSRRNERSKVVSADLFPKE